MSGGSADATIAARGALIVVSAPSGAGKTSLVRALAASEAGLVLSISHTTRRPRRGERDGEHYFFVSESEFEAMARSDGFLEHARVFDHRYGTARSTVAREREAGHDVVLEIDWQGAQQIRAAVPDALGVFILPPSRAALEQRLRERAQDDAAVIARRMSAARAEMSHWEEFDFLVVNDDFESALADLRCLLRGSRLRVARQALVLGPLVSGLMAP